MIGAATANCQSPCDDIARVIKTCTDAGADDELEVARCACAMSTLDVIRKRFLRSSALAVRCALTRTPFVDRQLCIMRLQRQDQYARPRDARMVQR